MNEKIIDESKVIPNELFRYITLRGIGRTRFRDVTIKTYIHFSSKKIIEIMETTYKHILASKNSEYKKQLLASLYYAAKTDMIINLKFNKVPIPQVYYDIENLHNHYFPKVLGIRRV